MELQNKVALVTGAWSGIGLALARKLVSAGCRVALVARTVKNLGSRGRGARGKKRDRVSPRDVTDRAAMAALPRQVVAKLGRLDILVNNAGYNYRASVQDCTRTSL